MREGYYRSRQAARALGVSSCHVQRLCELGLIETEFSGHQRRIPTSEIERLQRRGVSPIPSGEIAPHESNGAHSGQRLLAPPSDHATASAEETLMSEHQVEIAQNKLERIKAEREIEQQLDWFRQRAAQEAERRAQKAEQSERQAEANAQRQRAKWRQRWMLHGVPR